MKQTKYRLTAVALFICIFPTILPASRVDSSDNATCFRCHSLSTLGVRDSVLGGIRNLSVAPETFGHSIHGELDCIECHKQGYNTWPHNAAATAVANLACTECHQDPEKNLKSLFADIQLEFQRSVHEQRLGEHFSCFSCHDPHAFERQTSVTNRKIESANAMCTTCHDSEQNFKSLTKKSFPDLDATHAWLPNRDLHWETVRCVDCHSSYEAPNTSHNILPKEQAVTKCESCHQENSVLMAKLYKYQHRETRQKMGFVNGTLLNDAYVIGSTRNTFLDVLSIIIFGLTIVGVGGHGFLRYASAKKRKAEAEKEDTV